VLNFVSLPKLLYHFIVYQSIILKQFKFKIMALEFTDANFDELVIKSGKPVIVDLWAEWCGPCRMLTPIVEEMAKEYEGRAVIGKLNVDDNPEITAKFGVRNIPTLLFFKGGEIADKQVGAVPKSTLVSKLEKLF
jgi:thioredoxin 1